MGRLEDRWARRQAERPLTPGEQAEADARARAEEKARLAAELAPVEASTLSTASRPFEAVDVLQGEPCDDAAAALLSLKLAVRAAECDAVLGVGFSAAAFSVTGDAVPLAGGAVLPGPRKIAYQVFAYGTGVRWLPGG